MGPTLRGDLYMIVRDILEVLPKGREKVGGDLGHSKFPVSLATVFSLTRFAVCNKNLSLREPEIASDFSDCLVFLLAPVYVNNYVSMRLFSSGILLFCRYI